jgi:hypothetical protein
MEEKQTHVALHSDDNTMHEEPTLKQKELYQVCKYGRKHQDFQNLVVISYRPRFPEHHIKHVLEI